MGLGNGFRALWDYVSTYLNLIEVNGSGRYQVQRFGNDDGKSAVVELFDGEPQVIRRDGLEPVYRDEEERMG